MVHNLHIWASFGVGHGLYLWKQADEGAGKEKGVKARISWIKANYLSLSISAFIGLCLCGYWLLHPDFASSLASSLGIPANLQVTPNPATSGMFGLGSHAFSDTITNKLGIQKNTQPVS